ncbi:hypothetical protein G7Z17_g1968 [Cylindrodendrum hubeiense]|uniref:Stress response protein NST1 n=1 Tax=Cylindrodendrum hubeiense TaxID=595255 RepID=A0A9P5LKT0_9HYPO|nr:hypothetical protein G7Z17_g1968 [Cylindrodendrum hubeiense]
MSANNHIPAPPTLASLRNTAKYTNKDGSKCIAIPNDAASESSQSSIPTTTKAYDPPPDPSMINGPAPPGSGNTDHEIVPRDDEHEHALAFFEQSLPMTIEHTATEFASRKNKKETAGSASNTASPQAASPHVQSQASPGGLGFGMTRDKIWGTSNQEERERIKEFWLGLGEDERKSLVKVEKDAVVKKIKEQQKHTCSCTVCGRKRTAIEEELECLYDTYYNELEQQSAHQVEYIHDDEDKDKLEEVYSDEEYSDDEPPDELHLSHGRDVADFSMFGNSLQVKMDDLLKNDGKRFIEMMEQLAERRMAAQQEYTRDYLSRGSGHSSGSYSNAHNHPPPEDDECKDEEDEEEEYDDSQEDEEYEDEEYEDEEDQMTEEQRMEEGRRMFHIFAARMFEQRVLKAYRESRTSSSTLSPVTATEAPVTDGLDSVVKEEVRATKEPSYASPLSTTSISTASSSLTNKDALTWTSTPNNHDAFTAPTSLNIPARDDNSDEVDGKTDCDDIESLAAPDKEDYVSKIASDLFDKVWDGDTQAQPGRSPDELAMERIARKLGKLLKAFALKIGHSSHGVGPKINRDVMVFVYGNESDDSPGMTAEQKVDYLWRTDNGPPMAEIPPDCATESVDPYPYPGPAADNDAQVLDDDPDEKINERLRIYYEFLSKTPAYQWLLSRLRQELVLAPVKSDSGSDSDIDIMAKISDTIISSVQTRHVSRESSSQTYTMTFEIDWNPRVFIRDEEYQEHEGESGEAIGMALTLTGSAKNAQALSCGQYLTQTWPSTGKQILQLVKDVVRNGSSSQDLPDNTKLATRILGSKLIAKACGTVYSLAEIGEQFAWLGAALRSPSPPPPYELAVVCCQPSIMPIKAEESLSSSSSRHWSITFQSHTELESAGSSEGQCWFSFFRRPVVVEGYPILIRPEDGESDANYNPDGSLLERPHDRFRFAQVPLHRGESITRDRTTTLGNKDKGTPYGRGYVERLIWLAEETWVVLYDVKDSRGWLVDGASALLHLLRLSLKFEQSSRTRRHLYRLQMREYENVPELSEHRAINVLENKENRYQTLWGETMTFEDRVDDIYSTLELVLEDQKKSNEDHETFRGYLFLDVAQNKYHIRRCKRNLSPERSTWQHLTRGVNAAVLFGSGFGELIKPEGTEGLCKSWATVPRGMDYLTVHAADLERVLRDIGDRTQTPWRLVDGVHWYAPDTTFGECSCQVGTSEGQCEPVQVLLPEAVVKKRAPLTLTGPRGLSDGGAVIFGYNSRYWKKDSESKSFGSGSNRGSSTAGDGDSSSYYPRRTERSSSDSDLSTREQIEDLDSVYRAHIRQENDISFLQPTGHEASGEGSLQIGYPTTNKEENNSFGQSTAGIPFSLSNPPILGNAMVSVAVVVVVSRANFYWNTVLVSLITTLLYWVFFMPMRPKSLDQQRGQPSRASFHLVFAIHGLGSNPDSAWRYRGNLTDVYWLEDILPKQKGLKYTRITMLNHQTRWDSHVPAIDFSMYAKMMLDDIEHINQVWTSCLS